MAAPRVAHLFVNPIADDPAFPGTKPSDWNEDHVIEGLGETDTPTFAGLVLTDPLGNKWMITVTEDGNLSAEPLMLP